MNRADLWNPTKIFKGLYIFFCLIGKGRDLVAWRKCNSHQGCGDLVLKFTSSSCSVMAYTPALNLAWRLLKLWVKLLSSHPAAPPQSADKHQSLQSFIFLVTKKIFWDQNAASDSVLQMCGLQGHCQPRACQTAPEIPCSVLCHCRVTF